MAATITIAGTVTGGPSGTETFSVPIAVAGTIINDTNPVTLTTPTYSVNIPTGAVVMHFTPPPWNQFAIAIGTYNCHRTLPTLLALDPSQVTVTFSVPVAIPGCEIRWY